MGNPFRDPMMRRLYEGCRSACRDNFSEMYYGVGTHGPRYPRRGAGHRCAFWDGWTGSLSLYARAQGTLGYACWVAGRDERRSHP